MRKLSKQQCSILPLVLKGKWYDLIASGEKKEEYRDSKPFWDKRIGKWLGNKQAHFSYERLDTNDKYLVVGFSRGYKKPDMFFLLGYCERRGTSCNPGWGEPEDLHYVLGLGERVSFV